MKRQYEFKRENYGATVFTGCVEIKEGNTFLSPECSFSGFTMYFFIDALPEGKEKGYPAREQDEYWYAITDAVDEVDGLQQAIELLAHLPYTVSRHINGTDIDPVIMNNNKEVKMADQFNISDIELTGKNKEVFERVKQEVLGVINRRCEDIYRSMDLIAAEVDKVNIKMENLGKDICADMDILPAINVNTTLEKLYPAHYPAFALTRDGVDKTKPVLEWEGDDTQSKQTKGE